jgi:hypothetical protein
VDYLAGPDLVVEGEVEGGAEAWAGDVREGMKCYVVDGMCDAVQRILTLSVFRSIGDFAGRGIKPRPVRTPTAQHPTKETSA